MIFNVMHRNGSTIAFDTEKIMAAVEKALQSSSHNDSFTQEERQNYHSYVRILAELEWPAYINGDPIFHAAVIDRYETDGEKGVEDEIYRYYGALYLKDLEDQLSASLVIKKMCPGRSKKFERNNRISIGHVQTVQYITTVSTW